jgi:ankyrin repeat protein
MKLKKNLIILLLFVVWNVSAQKSIFDIARSGSVEELYQAMQTNKTIIDSKNESGYTPLILACYKRNNSVAKMLIEKGCDINYVSEMGSALMACSVNGNNEIALFLLNNNCNVNLTDGNGTTALMYAVQFGNIELVKALLAAKADKSKLDKNGKTAFEYAVFSGNNEITNLLK